MLTEICAEINNYFTLDEDKHVGNFEIVNGQITPPVTILEGQYYRIIGSVFNDGVHHSADVLIDEPKFNGEIWLMRIPKAVIDVYNEIVEWEDRNADVKSNPYTSESFAGYSYTVSNNTDGSIGLTWKNQADFRSKLRPYRKINVL